VIDMLACAAEYGAFETGIGFVVKWWYIKYTDFLD